MPETASPTADITPDFLSTVGIDPTIEPGAKPQPANPDAKGVPETPPAAPVKPAELPVEEDDVIGKAVAKAKKSRDFSDLPEELHDAFRNMGNEGFEKLKPMVVEYLKHKDSIPKLGELQSELEKLRGQQTPKSYFDHPDAYLLTDEYRDALTDRNLAADIRNHWQQQLALISEGKPFRAIVADKNGNPIISDQEIPASPAMQAKVQGMLSQAQLDYAQIQAKLDTLKEQLSGGYKSYNASVEQTFNKFFGKHAADLKPHADKYLEQLHPLLRARPEGKLLAYGLAALRIATTEQKQAQAQKAITQATAAIKKNAGPAETEIPADTRPKTNGMSDKEYQQFKSEFGI